MTDKDVVVRGLNVSELLRNYEEDLNTLEKVIEKHPPIFRPRHLLKPLWERQAWLAHYKERFLSYEEEEEEISETSREILDLVLAGAEKVKRRAVLRLLDDMKFEEEPRQINDPKWEEENESEEA